MLSSWRRWTLTSIYKNRKRSIGWARKRWHTSTTWSNIVELKTFSRWTGFLKSVSVFQRMNYSKNVNFYWFSLLSNSYRNALKTFSEPDSSITFSFESISHYLSTVCPRPSHLWDIKKKSSISLSDKCNQLTIKRAQESYEKTNRRDSSFRRSLWCDQSQVISTQS